MDALTIDQLIAVLSALPPEQRAKLAAFDGDGIMLTVDGVTDHPEYVELDGGLDVERTLRPEY